MGIVHETNEYHIPRGRVYFDPENPNTGLNIGEEPFGNCPGFTIAIAAEKSEHYSSQTALAQKDETKDIKVSRTGTLIVDNMSAENFARYLSGSIETVSQTAGNVTDETITVRKGRIYQLGKTTDNPAGVRNITNVVVTDEAGTTTYVANTDYALDLERGRLQILEGGSVVDDAAIKVDYTKPSASWKRIKTGAVASISCAIRIISDNASGKNRDWYMPKVNLTPSGDLPVIQEGTDYTRMTFEAEVLKPANGEAIYVDGLPETV